MVHRIIAVAVVAVLIIGFMVVHAIITPSDGGVSPVSTATVERGHFVDQVSSTGSIEPINSTVVAPQIDGTIGEVKVQEGATVNAGDVLFTINNDKLDSDVNQADLALRAANSNLNAAQQQVNQINVTIGQARNQDGEEGQAAADDAAGQLPAAQSGVESAQVAVQQAQATYDEAVAQANKRTVTAPVSGTVLTMSAVPGAAIVDEGKESSAVMLETNAETHEFKRVRVTVKAKNNTKAVVEGNVSKGDVIMLDGASAADNTGDAASSTSQTAASDERAR